MKLWFILPAKRLFNLEGTRVGSGSYSAPELSADKHAVTNLGIVFEHYSAGSHLITGLARTIIQWHWTIRLYTYTHHTHPPTPPHKHTPTHPNDTHPHTHTSHTHHTHTGLWGISAGLLFVIRSCLLIFVVNTYIIKYFLMFYYWTLQCKYSCFIILRLI